MSADETSAERAFAPICKAHGCPLPATHVTHWWPVEKRGQRPAPRWGVCDWHKQAEGVDWMAVVKRINEQLPLLRLLALLDAGIDAEAMPRAGESVADWRERLRRVLRGRILPGCKPAPPSAEAQAALDAILGRDRGAA